MQNFNKYVKGLRQGVYIAPSGARVQFDTESNNGFEFKQDRKVVLAEVPLQPAWVVQDLGLGNLNFSLEMVFAGKDADENAQKMLDALSETGAGMLLHPLGQDILCLATGWTHVPVQLSRLNIARISVNFIKCLKQPYPAVERDYSADIAAAQAELSNPAQSISQRIDSFTNNQYANFVDSVNNVFDTIFSPLGELAKISSEISQLFDQAVRDFNNLVSKNRGGVELMQSLGNICLLPSRVHLGLDDKQQAYEAAFGNMQVLNKSSEEAALAIDQTAATLAINQSACYQNAIVQSADDYIRFSNANAALYLSLLQDSSLESDSLNQVLSMLNLCNLAMSQASLSLPKKKSFILCDNVSVIEFVYQKFGLGNLERKLDDVIRQNRLNQNEILLLPKGREVIIYE